MDLSTSMGFFNEGSRPESEHKPYGTRLLLNQEEADWKSLKMGKSLENDDFSDSSKMLCFSSPDPEVVLMDGSSRCSDLPCVFYRHSYGRSTVNRFASSSINGGNQIHTVVGVSKQPFTPSQWLELENQALIFKYITAKIPIPSNLLNPIKKALESAAAFSFPGRFSSSGSLRTTPLGSMYLGFGSSVDMEPRRCRRTDGKKWRCSRDSMAEQKYCERHLNRGRHRSRKPVEVKCDAPAVARIVSDNNNKNSATAAHFTRFLQDRNTGSKSGQNSPESGIMSEFGFVSSDSLLNPLEIGSSFLKSPYHHLHPFIDNWSKAPPDPPDIEFQTDSLKTTHPTQLSISIPLSPLRISPNGGPLGEALQNVS